MGDPVSATLMILAATTAAYGQYQAGKATQYEYRRQAEQEKLSARDREIERRNRLLGALASRTVAAAAGGATLEGSPSALIARDVKEYGLESLSSEAMSASTQAGLRAAGTNAYRIGVINAASSLFQAGAAAASLRVNTPKAPSSGGGSGTFKTKA